MRWLGCREIPLSLVVLVSGLGCGSSTGTSAAPSEGSSGGTGGSLGTAGSTAGGVAGGATAAGTAGVGGTAAGSGSVRDLPNRACSTSVVAPEASCAGAEAVPIDNPTSLVDEMYNQALESEWRALFGVIGQYACGSAPIYRGSFGAGFGGAEEEWPAAIASLVMGEGVDWIGSGLLGIHLTVFDPGSSAKALLFERQQGTTEVAFVSGSTVTVGTGASCSGCLPGLQARPERLAFDFVASGQAGDGTPLEVAVNGSFSRIPPAELSFSDIDSVIDERNSLAQEASEIVASFEPCGAELVRRSEGTRFAATVAPEGTEYRDEQCRISADFSAIWHLDADRLGAHGIRALTVEPPRYCCSADADEGSQTIEECFDL